MVTLNVGGDKAESAGRPEVQLPELAAIGQADDVLAFSRSKGLDEHLRKAATLARQVFAPVERIEAEVHRDPETDDAWIVLRVAVRGDRVAVSAARKKYTAEWVATVPPALRFLIRLSPDIL